MTDTTPDQGDERSKAYDLLYHFLNNNISSCDWRQYSDALDLLYSAQPVAQPVVDQEPASMSDNGSCGSQVSGKPVSAEPDRYKRALEAIIANPGGASAKRIATLALGLDGTEQVSAEAGKGVVHQFRKKHCSDWYDGFPDTEDGGGPYETRTLYVHPSESVVVSGEDWHEPRQLIAGARERANMVATEGSEAWLAEFTRAVLALAAPMSQPEPTSRGACDHSQKEIVSYWACVECGHVPAFDSVPSSQQREPQEAEEPWEDGNGVIRNGVLPDAPQEAGKAEPCRSCNDTGDVHSIDGEWRGFCSCAAGIAAMNKPSKHGEWVKLSASKEASKVEPVADYQRGWKDGNDTANRAHAALAASPMFWVRLLADGLYEGPLHYKSADLQECRDANPSEWHPLHLHPAPQALSDEEIIDIARVASTVNNYSNGRFASAIFEREHAIAFARAILAAAGGGEK